ncbi:HAMP domain-containing histidine kinase [Sulfurimonas sp. NWX367]
MRYKKVLFLLTLLLVHIVFLENLNSLEPYIKYYIIFNIFTILYFLWLKIKLVHLNSYITDTIVSIEKEILYDNIQPLCIPKNIQEIKQFVEEVNKIIFYLNQKNKVAQSFNANMAHELKTPLAELKAKLEYSLYYTALQDNLATELRAFIQKINSLENIVSQMLYVSNNNIKKLNNSMQRVLLNDILYSILDTKKSEIEAKHLKTDIEINQAISIHGHEKLLQHAIGNIIDNAIKYSLPNKRIKIILRKKKNFIFLAIIDYGIGIDKKELKLIFHPYYRGENAFSNSEGYGLGLSLATWILELHSASIKIRSKKGKGTFVGVKFYTS